MGYFHTWLRVGLCELSPRSSPTPVCCMPGQASVCQLTTLSLCLCLSMCDWNNSAIAKSLSTPLARMSLVTPATNSRYSFSCLLWMQKELVIHMADWPHNLSLALHLGPCVHGYFNLKYLSPNLYVASNKWWCLSLNLPTFPGHRGKRLFLFYVTQVYGKIMAKLNACAIHTSSQLTLPLVFSLKFVNCSKSTRDIYCNACGC